MTVDERLPRTEDLLDLADDLVRTLAEHVADSDAVSRVLSDTLEELGAETLALACTAAVRTVFADWLTVVPHVPPGKTTFHRPKEHQP